MLVQSQTEWKTRELGARLSYFETALRAAVDDEHADKLAELKGKASSTKLNVAFCGHFSAGKSSLINRLCGESLLPASPVPTSANIIYIQYGTSKAVVYPHQGNPVEIAVSELPAYARNGQAIERVELFTDAPLLAGGLTLLDTPGVDSTDEGHRMSTESALHLADVVFYVTDYNYVQSEMNASFMKQLLDWGKPLYLVVNMIDKHREEELSFEQFASGVRKAFSDRGLSPVDIAFVSVKQPAHPLSEWNRLVGLLDGLKPYREELAYRSILQSAAYLAARHAETAAEASTEEKERLSEELQADADAESAQLRLEELTRLAQEAGKVSGDVLADLTTEIENITRNANLTPAETRELVQQVLESRKPGFKVGLFFAGSKTEAEKERRLQLLLDSLTEKSNVNLLWHLQSLLKRKLEELGLRSDEWLAKIEQLSLPISAEWISGKIRSGAEVNGQYVLNFSRELSDELKSVARRSALSLAELLAEAASAAANGAVKQHAAEMSQLKQRLSARLKLDQLEQREREYAESMIAMAGGGAGKALPELPLFRQFAAYQAEAQESDSAASEPASDWSLAMEPVPEADDRSSLHERQSSTGESLRRKLRSAAERLHRGSELIRDLPGTATLVRSMSEKAVRLTDSRFTIALFGAFSAGKSSFANALMGSRMLPVSPNPTTAAINQIVPPEPGTDQDGTALVLMKTLERMESDIQAAWQALGRLPEASVNGVFKQLRSIDPSAVPPAGKPHLAFLRAASEGWEHALPLLGEAVLADEDAFRAYVAEERKSCFVERIDLRRSSPLTEQGIVLVDTPGADSVNARHTGVAFTYMKNADAILFVTYYNHAFSQADRQFLEQLGRVKDAFALDKMFFIVNAADLASSREELDQVVAHLKANLLTFGIRNPRIYPVSSLQALDAKLSGDAEALARSGFRRFESDFFTFAEEELAELAVASANSELRRAVLTLKQWLAAVREDEGSRQARLQHTMQALEEAARELDGEAGQLDQEELELKRETEELMYYVKQRIRHRFGEWINFCFNPSLFPSGSDARTSLRIAYADLTRLIRTELSNESLATTLRVEAYLRKQLIKRGVRLTETVKRYVPDYSGEVELSAEQRAPEAVPPFAAPAVDDKLLMASFKNAKYFFEGDGKKLLREQLERMLEQSLTDAVDIVTSTYSEFYSNLLREENAGMEEQLRASLREHQDGMMASLTERIDPNQLAERMEHMGAIL